MAKILSDNPTQTTQRARQNEVSYRYPLNETLSSMTRLRFVEYDRFNPWDEASETTTATITLPLPVTVPENYSISITGHEMGMYGNVTNDNWDKIKNFSTSGTDWAEEAKQLRDVGVSAAASAIRERRFNMAAALAGIGMASNSSDLHRTIASFTGMVRNPHTTVIFEGVNLRNINLEWRFSARSEDESRALKNIFDTIKLRTHPEELASGYALNYPDLVYIEFDGKVKEYLPKYQKAFISNINITPDSSGGMSLFKSGAPTTYNFQLSATEISIVTRNTLQEQLQGGQN